MASALRLLAVILLLFPLTTTTVTAVEDDELESMLNVLRARGYNLFSNAIATTDLIFEVLTGKSFTFFAPTDSSLFTLDMTNTASDYISTLLCHVIPFRVPFSELRRFGSRSSLPTLATNHRATVRVDRGGSTTSSGDDITVDGVGVLLPGLFYSRNLAVHGLGGILNCTSDQESPPLKKKSPSQPPPSNFSSEIDSQSSRNGYNTKAPSPSLANLPDDDSFNSPAVTESEEKPNSGDMDDGHKIIPPERQPPVSRGFSPADSPAEPQFSPAYNLWLEAPTYRHFAPSSEPLPPPEFSENDDPMALPPSTTDAIENLGDHMVATDSELGSLNENELSLIDKDGRKSAVPDHIPVTPTEEDGVGNKETGPKKSQPSDEATFDCQVTDGFDDVSFPYGYMYTRKPKYPMSCSSSSGWKYN